MGLGINTEKQVKNFEQLKAVSTLRLLAHKPIDLTAQLLTDERFQKYRAAACGYQFLYATQRVDDATMVALEELAAETNALEKMGQMQAGSIVNVIEGVASEKRPALHTATRDFFEDPNGTPEAQAAASQAFGEIAKLKVFIAKIDKEERFDEMVVVGIGGSELGPKAHYEALSYLQKGKRRVHFVGNIDPDSLGLTFRSINLAKTLVLVISKTGTTIETVANETILRRHFESAGLKSKEHFISVTCQGSPLDTLDQYRAVFNIWEWVGGRYSTTSMVGGVLLTFAFGFDVYWEFLRGAHAMDRAALSPQLDSNPPLVAALLGIWNRNFLGHPVVGVIPYSQALARFPAHLQQLDMESNGKHVDKRGHFVTFDTGPIIFGEPGTNAQHSFYQSIHQGTTVIPLELIGFKLPQIDMETSVDGTTSQQKLLANLFAQVLALAVGQENNNPNKEFDGNRPTSLLLGKQLTPFALGALLAFYEHKVAFQGFIWDINSFDQEGVQLGKVLATKVLHRFGQQNNPSAHFDEYPLGQSLINILDKL
jgi:glucose-6-phosphate isomerase